jgi:FkbM family methyltransferase
MSSSVSRTAIEADRASPAGLQSRFMLGPIRRHRVYRRMRKRLRIRFGRRDRFFRRAAKLTPYLGVDAGRAVYFVSTADSSVGRSLFAKQGVRKEHLQLERALRILDRSGTPQPRRTIVDAGANIGTTVVSALLDLGFVDALAFEPESTNFRLLRANLAVNGLDGRARAYKLALSDRSGEALLDVSSANAGSYWVLREGVGEHSTERVRTARLDEVLEEAGIPPDTVDLLWMDVQGHEPHVLAGAPRLLERSPPLVLEFSPGYLRRSGGLDLLLQQLGRAYSYVYDLRHPEEEPLPASSLQPLLDRYGRSFTDLLAVREARASR